MPGWVVWVALLLPAVVVGGHLNSWIVGWWSLARHYRLREPFRGTRRRFRSCSFRYGSHIGCVTFGADAGGLYMAQTLPLVVGHPPLYIPWSDVTATAREEWFGRQLELRFAAAPGVPVRLSGPLGRQLAVDANRAWAEGPPAA